MLGIKKFIEMLISGAEKVIGAKDELTEIDSRFGDADHGITMEKIMNSVKREIGEPRDDAQFRQILDDASTGVMMINGGSSVPLWSTMFGGMSEGAPMSSEINEVELKQIFRQGYESLFALSKAKPGDKTMMDSLTPAVEAICSTEGDFNEIMAAGAKAAIEGAEASKNFVSKFGRAKSYREQTIGTPDAGASSMKYFFVGMYEAISRSINKETIN